MPMIGFSASPGKKVRTAITVSHVTVPEDDGSGNGKTRGWWYAASMDFDMGSGLLLSQDKITSCLVLEVLDPGGYWALDDTAIFFKWQVAYKF
jgi:hypothetical protein